MTTIRVPRGDTTSHFDRKWKEEVSRRIEEASSATGEVNTGSNVGSSGIGVYDGKVGVDLQFRKINSDATLDVTLGTQTVDLGLASNQKTACIGIVIDGGGSAITTGVKGDVRVPYNCTITGWDIVADQVGSIVIDVWKDTYANFPPTALDSIAGSEKPTLTAADKNQDTSLSSWGTTLSADDYIRFNVDSAATVTRVTLQLRVTKT